MHLRLDLGWVRLPVEYDGSVVAAVLSPELHVLPIWRRQAVHALHTASAALHASFI